MEYKSKVLLKEYQVTKQIAININVLIVIILILSYDTIILSSSNYY